MKTLKTMFYHYLIGVLFSASITALVIIFDYYFNGYFTYPELGNFVKVCLISGFGFGLTHFAFINYVKSKKN